MCKIKTIVVIFTAFTLADCRGRNSSRSEPKIIDRTPVSVLEYCYQIEILIQNDLRSELQNSYTTYNEK